MFPFSALGPLAVGFDRPMSLIRLVQGSLLLNRLVVEEIIRALPFAGKARRAVSIFSQGVVPVREWIPAFT